MQLPMPLFENLLRNEEEALNAAIKASKERFAAVKKLCGELQADIDATQVNDGEGALRTDVAEGEKILGTLPEPLRRLFVVCSRMMDEMEAERDGVMEDMMAVVMDTPMRDLDPVKIAARMHEIYPDHCKHKERMELVTAVFWLLVGEAFPNPECDSGANDLGIRKDWLVVSAPKKRTPSITLGQPIMVSAEQLQSLFGG